MCDIILAFVLSLGITILLELFAALLFKIDKKDYLLIILVNILTNPAVVYINMVLSRSLQWRVPLWQIALEAIVIATEGEILTRFSYSTRSMRKFAFAANVFSYSLGILMNLIV